MKEITDEVLIGAGFTSNHPERVLKKYYKSGKINNAEYRVMVEQNYIGGSNNLSYISSCWKTNEHGTIVKRGSLSFITDYQDLKTMCELCDIPLPEVA